MYSSFFSTTLRQAIALSGNLERRPHFRFAILERIAIYMDGTCFSLKFSKPTREQYHEFE